MSTDTFQYLPIDQWCKLKDAFKRDWPRSISGFTVLDTMEYIMNKHGGDYGFKVYCPYGDVNNGMVALNVKAEFAEYIIQCPKDDTSKMEEALRTTKILEVARFEVPFAPKHVMKMVLRVAPYLNMKLEGPVSTTETFLLNKNTPFNVDLPAGFTFEPLSLSYVEQVDAVWPHRYPTSQWYFELMTKAKLAYGLFDNQDLVAWVYVKEMGALCHLYTVKEHRRKGYGEMVLKSISNVLMEQGKPVFAFCVAGNTTARDLYVKMGFDSIQDVDWAFFVKE